MRKPGDLEAQRVFGQFLVSLVGVLGEDEGKIGARFVALALCRNEVKPADVQLVADIVALAHQLRMNERGVNHASLRLVEVRQCLVPLFRNLVAVPDLAGERYPQGLNFKAHFPVRIIERHLVLLAWPSDERSLSTAPSTMALSQRDQRPCSGASSYGTRTD